MDREKEQELEWLEAQKIETSVDLFASAKKHLQFLETVDRNRELYDGPVLDRAIYRYNACWLPLLAKYSESSVSEGPLVPPLDCEWIWHCHRLNPVRYKSDCEQFYGRVLDNSGVVSSVNGNCKSKTQGLWKRLYPGEPYDLDFDKGDSEDVSEKSSCLEKCTKYDLVSAVKRQSPFYYQVSRSHVTNDIFIQEAVARYKGFLYLIKKNRERSLNRFNVPTYDVDLIWHTHQLHPVSYCNDLEKLIGKVLEHDDTDSDRGKGKKLDTGFSKTTAQWEETFGTRYWKAGAMYRGKTPAPVTTSPYASDVLAKKPTENEDYQNLIQFLELEVVEVLLEIIGVRNLPDGHKGKLSVVFTKTRPDSLFNAERRLTILSEVGEKQVASFQCEPTGELCFQLISSSPSKIPVSREPKNLGFASLSLKEFLSPVITQLSVEKWLELTPAKGKTDLKPISLRVAVSFTPPSRRPSILHMAQPRPSCKGSCFFPIIGKSRHAKSSTQIVDDTQTEVITLRMSDGAAPKDDHSAQRQVIGVVNSGETRVLAEYKGSFWSLLDSEWSLKQVNADNTLFELLGTRLVKIFSGRKLDYEPKHCANIRSDQDFMTLVEFSKEHPYGKAVGLLDLRFGSIEVKENWLVLPGIVSAFILNNVLKKGGFDGFNATTKVIQHESLKTNGLKEESKQTKLVVAVENKVNANTAETAAAIIAPEKGSGCGGGCSGECMVKAATNASGCGSGCSGECGDMMKAATNATGCGSGCSGECGDMVKATANASGCGSGCNGDCGGMMKATANASGCGSGCNGDCGGMMKAAKASGCGSDCSGECGGDMVNAEKASSCGGGCNGECGGNAVTAVAVA
ncbi:hypothetical protein AALP_AA5G202400 [Arabis alpina]|uniref:Glycine-rich domain-containing protein 1 n=1 Tax=Arabis alpina TaxID=50452 RepID=A0A087GYA8_ARAAL|nr:hypothetical protein AALP_AA5G202400 [Arabis alpina]